MVAAYKALLKGIEKSLAEFKEDRWFVIGIDGNCGSGKSTLALLLSNELDCDVIQVDDFFLLGELRTAERLAEIAGNFHYERFEAEVLRGIKLGKIEYRKFDCQVMDYTDRVVIRPNKVLIIEGSYSFSHDFNEYYDFKVLTKCSEHVQIERIRNRSGEAMLQQFVEKWIPLENRYFIGEHPETKANFVLCTDDNIL